MLPPPTAPHSAPGIEKTISEDASDATTPIVLGQTALQDYQMQIMLLEQQNKKRTYMCRREQDNNAGSSKQGYQRQLNKARLLPARQERDKYLQQDHQIQQNRTGFHPYAYPQDPILQSQGPVPQGQDLMAQDSIAGPPKYDMETQLKMLEDQCKRRCESARRMQPAGPPGNTTFEFVHEHPVPGQTNAERRRHSTCTTETSAGSGEAPPSKKQKQKQKQKQNQNQNQNENQNPIQQDCQSTTSTSSSVQSVTPPAPPGRRILPEVDLIYVVVCNDVENHAVPAFRDLPVLQMPLGHEGRSHLNGTIPVFDLKAIMECETDDVGVAFTIVRKVECTEHSVLKAHAGASLQWDESIYMKSKLAKDILNRVATCYFQPSSHGTHSSLESIGAGMLKSYAQNRIEPAKLFFYHHKELLREHALKNPESDQHVDALLGYAGNWFGQEFRQAESLIESGFISQALILYLFRPNDILVTEVHGKPTGVVLHEWAMFSGGGSVSLQCWSYQTDGSVFLRKQMHILIPAIEKDTVNIRTLCAYPLRFASQETRDSIRRCGEAQWKLRKTEHVTYKGWNVAKDQFFPEARFIIDHKTYRKIHEGASAFCFPSTTMAHPFDNLPRHLDPDATPPDTIFYLMAPDITGFFLSEKKWIKLFVDCIYPVEWNKKAFDRLVLLDQTKELVRALVTVRTSQKGIKQGLGLAGKRTDIISSKGNGLIMLLHGDAGTGKTLTAESVAEMAEMPLYRVTCGDVGIDAKSVENYLATVLHLGQIWGCVLLLDEADVFLEERCMGDLKRNSLVSVFLRILEYYDGILILTSNRVGVFDEAFKSRIQVALHYPNLDEPARRRIWLNFFEMLDEDGEDADLGELSSHLGELAAKDLNGRQIRNTLTTARQLCLFKRETLGWRHLEQALLVSLHFNESLKQVRGQGRGDETGKERRREAEVAVPPLTMRGPETGLWSWAYRG